MLPRLGALLSDWAPLEDPQRGRAEFAAWRPLLESDAQREAIFQVWAPNRKTNLCLFEARQIPLCLPWIHRFSSVEHHAASSCCRAMHAADCIPMHRGCGADVWLCIMHFQQQAALLTCFLRQRDAKHGTIGDMH